MSCESKSERMKVAVASSLYDVFKTEVEPKFPSVEFVYGSSGKFSNQIEFGAPFFAFVSAESKFGERLNVFKKRLNLFSNPLMICGKKEFVNKCPAQIVIPNPEVAPVGKLAKSWLTKMQCLTSDVKVIEGINAAHSVQLFNESDVEFLMSSNLLKAKVEQNKKCVDLREYQSQYEIFYKEESEIITEVIKEIKKAVDK